MRESIGCNELSYSINNNKKLKSEEERETEVEEGGGGEEETSALLVVPPSFVVVGRSRSQTGSGVRRVTPTTATTTAAAAANNSDKSVEKVLPNGDLYTGSFVGNVPHGTGKYLWRDGCMYEGDWRKGKASGKGKFSWPSGATFEGEFKSGRMDGFGTLLVLMVIRYGQKSYANGDFYEGLWKRNLQEGQGRYVWRNGNEYQGDWKNGVISGRGVLIWANGNRYEGQWENGVPKGHGTFTWPDGSSYVGCWNNNLKNQLLNGTFYPGTASGGAGDIKDLISCNGVVNNQRRSLSEENFLLTTNRKRSSVDGGRGSLAEKNFPRICIWESDGDAGDITCDILDNVEASMFYRDGTHLDHGLGGGATQIRRSPVCFTGEAKKPGQTVAKGHKNYELMLNLQLGIRHSAGKHASILRELRPSDFDSREKFWTRFPSEGSKVTPPHQTAEFRWKDYCPMVFRHLRELFAIDRADYMLAICGNDALRELSSQGKAEASFYMTQDDRFMIKTVKKSEVKMLQSYYQHVCRHENSWLRSFLGCTTRFIVMGNLFCSEYRIHRRFDLKGSSHGRTTDKPEGEIDETTTLKDLDLNFVFRLQKSWFEELIRQIDRDCEFLEAERIMDYSLLVGLHFREDYPGDKAGMSPLFAPSGKTDSAAVRGCNIFSDKDMDRVISGRKPLIRLGANMPAKAEQVPRIEFDQYSPFANGNSIGAFSGDVYDVVLYFGVIDILQDYDISKKLEHAYKSLQADPTSISAVDPKLYSKRFRDFVGRIFLEDKS
ncbi:hypothetical protein MKW92_030206 [Papaver armeniacum]|nr:hypothetical protein MKW92_030206 [Papaver armeniacum]